MQHPNEINAVKRSSAAWWWIALAVVLAGHLPLQLQNLGHTSIKPLDEIFHATVARNFLKDPLTPTLFDRPFVEPDDLDWQRGHIWLHKPPMAMWQIALSYLLFGVNALALRLPSALLATAAVGLTYLTGKELISRTAALAAATLQASNHAIMMLVHGYVFSDHVDIALLFWVQLAIYLLVRGLRRGRSEMLVLAGVAQGAAYLSKSYPALIVTGIALVAWLAPMLHLASRRWRVTGRQLLMLIAATLLTIAPWTIYCLLRWPELFLWENAGILRHLNRDVEGWAAPWDRVIFDYLIRVMHWFYAMWFAGTILLGWRAWRRRDVRLWLLLGWALGVIIPHALATSKTPTATLIGWPAMWLTIGWLIARSLRRDRVALSLWLSGVVVPLIFRSEVPARGWGYPDPPVIAGVLRENSWIAWQILAVGMLSGGMYWLLARESVRRAAIAVAGVGTLLIAGTITHIAVRVTQQDLNDLHILEIAAFVSRLPESAVLLVDEQEKLEHLLLMFWSDRTSYRIGERPWGQIAREVIANGGVPYIVSPHHYGLPQVFTAQQSNRAIFACTPLAHQIAETIPP
jgi:4-amino-4-deoxy-L-arabinose transferase-like glycosyltransferase